MVQIEASIQELAQEGMEMRLAAAQAARDQRQAACEEAGTAVEAAERELAGAQAGDGRDESNRSLQERLADAQNAQARLLLKTVSTCCRSVVCRVILPQQLWPSQSQSRASLLANDVAARQRAIGLLVMWCFSKVCCHVRGARRYKSLWTALPS